MDQHIADRDGEGLCQAGKFIRKIIRDTVEIPGRDRYIFRQGAIPLDTQGTAAAAELGVAQAADLTVTAGIQVRLADDTLSNGEAQALPYRFHYGTYKLVPHDDGRAAVSQLALPDVHIQAAGSAGVNPDKDIILFGKGGDGAFRQAGGVSALGLFIYCFHFRLLLSGQIPAPYDRAARRPRGRWSACRG